jgi:hypothetical protein
MKIGAGRHRPKQNSDLATQARLKEALGLFRHLDPDQVSFNPVSAASRRRPGQNSGWNTTPLPRRSYFDFSLRVNNRSARERLFVDGLQSESAELG